jgi:alpha-galactosidase
MAKVGQWEQGVRGGGGGWCHADADAVLLMQGRRGVPSRFDLKVLGAHLSTERFCPWQ